MQHAEIFFDYAIVCSVKCGLQQLNKRFLSTQQGALDSLGEGQEVNLKGSSRHSRQFQLFQLSYF